MAAIAASAKGGKWSETAAWEGAKVPGKEDDVTLGVSAGNITVAATAECRSLSAAAYVNTLTIESAIKLKVGFSTANGTLSFKLGTGNLLGGTGILEFVSTSGVEEEVNLKAGTAVPWEIIFNSSTGKWKHVAGENFEVSGRYVTTLGTIKTENVNITNSGRFVLNAGKLKAGKSVLKATGTGECWRCSTGVLEPEESILELTNASETAKNCNVIEGTYNKVVWASDNIKWGSGTTIAKLEINTKGKSVKGTLIAAAAAMTITESVTTNATATEKVKVLCETIGSQWKLKTTSLKIELENVELGGCVAESTGIPFIITNGKNLGGTSNVRFLPQEEFVPPPPPGPRARIPSGFHTPFPPFVLETPRPISITLKEFEAVLWRFVIDSFIRSTENPLSNGGKWSLAEVLQEGTEAVNAGKISSTEGYQAIATFAKANSAAYWNPTEFTEPTVTAEVVTSPGGTGRYLALLACVQVVGVGEFSGYRGLFEGEGASASTIAVQKFIKSGAYETIASVSGFTGMEAGDLLRLTVAGNKVTAWFKNSHTGVFEEVVSGVDSTWTKGFVGVGVRGNLGELRWFEVEKPGAFTSLTKSFSISNQLTAAVLGATATLTKAFTFARKLTLAVLEPKASLSRFITKTLALAVLEPKAAFTKAFAISTKLTTAVLEPKATLTKAFSIAKSLPASITPTALLTKALTVTRTLTAQMKPTSLFNKVLFIAKTFTASVKPAAIFAKALEMAKTFTASETPTATAFSKILTITKTFIVEVKPTALLTKAFAIAHTLPAEMKASALLTKAFTVTSTLKATLEPKALLTKALTMAKTFTAKVEPQAAFAKVLFIAKTFAASVTPTLTLFETKKIINLIKREFEAAMTATATLTKQFGVTRLLTATVEPKALFAKAFAIAKVLPASITPTSLLTKVLTVTSTLKASMKPTFVSLNRIIFKALEAKVAVTALLTKAFTIAKSLPASLTPSALLTKALSMTKIFPAQVEPKAVLTKVLTMTKIFTARVLETSMVDSFLRADEKPLNATNWQPIQGAVENHPGEIKEESYASENTFAEGLNGAYWTQNEYSTPFVSAEVHVLQGVEKGLFNLWICLTKPKESTKSGYRLVVSEEAAAGKYRFAVQKFENGTETEPGEKAGVLLEVGDLIGIQQTGTKVKAWHKKGAGAWEEVFSVNSSTYTTGFIGIGAKGNAGRLRNFAIAQVATLTRTLFIAKTFIAKIEPKGTLTSLLSKTFTAIMEPKATLKKVLTVTAKLLASITPSGLLTVFEEGRRRFTATMAVTATQSKNLFITKTFTAKVQAEALLTKVLTITRTLTATLKPSSVLSKALTIAKTFTAKVEATGLLTKVLTVTRTLIAELKPTGLLTKVLSVTRTLTAQIQPTALLSKAFALARTLAASIKPQGNLVLAVSKSLKAVLEFTGKAFSNEKIQVLKANLEFFAQSFPIIKQALKAIFSPSAFMDTEIYETVLAVFGPIINFAKGFDRLVGNLPNASLIATAFRLKNELGEFPEMELESVRNRLEKALKGS